MADVINLGQRVSSVDVSPQFQPYSKVIIHINDDEAIEVGNNTGRTLEFDNPFGSREMAQNILNRLSGYQYQPYQADGALLDPAAEIGDAVGTATSYGGLFTRSRKFGRLMKADISAPHDEEINHEFKYESPQERKFTRVTGEIRASIILTNNMIQSEVVARRSADDEMSSRITQTADSITAEVVRATSAEGNLSTRITQTANSITAEVSRATAAEGNLSTRITQTESSITTEVTREETRAKQAESSLSSRITQNANGITAEVRRATQAEGNLQSSLSIQASEIAAKVSASGGGGSFSWVLNSSSHTWKANNTEVMRVSASGLWLKGAIEASSGKIGGFDIGANALSYNGLTWGDTSKNYGAYIGQNGIQLGQNFAVDNGGNLRARNIDLYGSLNFYNYNGSYAGSMSTANFLTGASEAYNNYGSWNGTTSTVNSNGSYWTGGSGAGYNAYNGLTGTYMQTIHLNSGVFKMNNHNVYLGTLYINGTAHKVLEWI